MGKDFGKKGKSLKNIRPTSGKVLLALFNILKASGRMADADFLDLFAGTGEISVAALRSGARSVTAVEADRTMAAQIGGRLAEHGDSARCICADVRRALPRFVRDGATYDVIFADPPYNMGWGVELIELIEKNISIIAPGGVFVFEHSSRENLAELSIPRDDRTYGETVLSFYHISGGVS